VQAANLEGGRAAGRGWLEAAAFVTAIGALSLVYAVGHGLGAHPVAFILYATLTAAAAMLALTGPGSDARAIALHPSSWVVGLAIILIEVFYYLVLAYVPPAHGNLVLRVSIPIAMAVGYLLLGRRSPPLGVAGGALILITLACVIGITDARVRWPMALFGVLTAIVMVLRAFTAELHPHNRCARTVRQKVRVTGVLMLVTSVVGLVLTGGAVLGTEAGLIGPLALVPTAAQMAHGPTIALSALAGGAVLALMNYLSFSSVVKIGTENLTATMAFSPATSWAFQELGVAAGWIAAERPDSRLVAAMATLIAAVLLIFWAGRPRGAGPAARAADRVST
jgi:hypothetical protein